MSECNHPDGGPCEYGGNCPNYGHPEIWCYWTQISLYKEVENRGFFCYSGEDGDLYRKQRFGGWRIQLYWGTQLCIQRLVKDWAGRRWLTRARFEGLDTDDKKKKVLKFVDQWLDDPDILEPPKGRYMQITMEHLTTAGELVAESGNSAIYG